ncbi:MAG: hypothetical protein ACRCZF_16310, partial [Gemmataceae bacterium]
MPTTRGWYLLLIGVLFSISGGVWVAHVSPTIGLVGLALVLLFLLERIWFQFRQIVVLPKLELERSLWQGGRPVASVWAGSPCEVRIRLRNSSRYSLSSIEVEENLPEFLRNVPSFTSVTEAPLPAGGTLELRYPFRPTAAGVLHFEGVTLRLTDLSGLFVHRSFFRQRQQFLVLPALGNNDGHPRGIKHANTLPPPGVNRLRKPGGGSELLDL